MIHLMAKNHVIPVVAFLNKRWKEQDTDISLIRHFVMEVIFSKINFISVAKIKCTHYINSEY